MNSRRMGGLVAMMSLVVALGQSQAHAASPGHAAGARSVSLATHTPESAACPMTFQVSVRRRTQVTLSICDPNGWVVQTLVDETLEPGQHQAMWDGRDDAGRAVQGSAYLAVLRADGKVVSQPIVLKPSRHAR